MKLILAFKMKAMKGLFESFFFLFSTAYFKRYTILLTTYKSRKIKCYNYLLSFFLFIYVRDIITTMFHITEFIDT